MPRLERLRTADGRTLSPRLKAEILRELQRLELVIGMIKTIEAERDAIASAKIETSIAAQNGSRIWPKSSVSGPNLQLHLSAKCSTAFLTIASSWRATSV